MKQKRRKPSLYCRGFAKPKYEYENERVIEHVGNYFEQWGDINL